MISDPRQRRILIQSPSRSVTSISQLVVGFDLHRSRPSAFRRRALGCRRKSQRFRNVLLRGDGDDVALVVRIVSVLAAGERLEIAQAHAALDAPAHDGTIALLNLDCDRRHGVGVWSYSRKCEKTSVRQENFIFR